MNHLPTCGRDCDGTKCEEVWARATYGNVRWNVATGLWERVEAEYCRCGSESCPKKHAWEF